MDWGGMGMGAPESTLVDVADVRRNRHALAMRVCVATSPPAGVKS